MKIVNSSGKRKTAIARATIREGKGRVRVNKKPIEIFEPAMIRFKMSEPLDFASNVIPQVDIDINVHGGGIFGQAGAVRTAIARGLVEWTNDMALRDAMATYDRSLLVNDTRYKLPKKFGGRGARKRSQNLYRLSMRLVRCFACSKVVSNVWDERRKRIFPGDTGKVLEYL